MPASPLLPLVTPSMQAPSSGVLNQASTNKNGAYSPLQPITATQEGLEQADSGLSFFQQLQMANHSSVLSEGQELAAYLPQALGQEEVEIPEFDADFIGPLPQAAQVEQTNTHGNTLYGQLPQGQVLASDTQDVPQGLQYLESLRRAQPHVQANMATEDGLTDDTLEAGLTKTSGTQSGLDTRLQTQTSTIQTNANEQATNPVMAMTAQANKTINLDELGMEAVTEEVSLDGIELDTKSLHETPMTLKTLKESVATPPITQAFESTLMQDAKANLVEMPTAMGKESQNIKSLALEQDARVQTQNAEKMPVTFNKLDVPPHHPQWNDQVAKRISIMANESVQSARIQLDPPELGSLEIKVKVQQDQVSVTFGSNNQQVRDALEAQAPRLRESLEQQGINLADVNVSEHGTQQGGHGQDDTQENGLGGEEGEFADAQVDDSTISLEGDSLVDYFA